MIVNRVVGSTKVLGIIGKPIEHTFSPVIHNTIAKELGHNLAYLPFLVEEDNLEAAVKGAHALGIQGLNVTMPHKSQVIKYLPEVEETAGIIAAVNTLKYTENGYTGYNTDILGIKETFFQNKINILGKSCLIIGAGGSANAVASALITEEAGEIYIVNRSLQNALSIAENGKKYYNKEIKVLSYDKLQNFDKWDIVVQTTPLGFYGESPIKDNSFFDKVDICFDILYNPWETPFLKEAASHGITCINGFEMLVYQAIASYEIWNDLKIGSEFKQKIVQELKSYFKRENNV